MNLFQALLLGSVQGLAEFLPISSSGHLVVLQQAMGITDPSPFFEVFLHAATLLAVLIFFRKKVLRLSFSELVLLGVASIPAAIAGSLFGSRILTTFSSPLIVGVALIITGFINFLIDKILGKQHRAGEETAEFSEITVSQALKIGVFQMVALVPGISRSGATVFGGLKVGLSRLNAFEFSFLASVPVIIGANIFELVRSGGNDLTSIDPPLVAVAFVAAFATGIFSLGLLRKMMLKAKFEYFAFYCWIAGAALVISSLAGIF